MVQETNPYGIPEYATYDAFGQVLTRTDRLGKTTTFAYDDVNRKVTVTTPEGIVTSVTKNRFGQQVTVLAASSSSCRRTSARWPETSSISRDRSPVSR